jgi:hypothetical protein
MSPLNDSPVNLFPVNASPVNASPPSTLPVQPPSLAPSGAVSHLPTPWDMAGAEGREVAKQLFGDRVDQLAAFQSFETILEGKPCGVLRLCERNFRISYPGPLEQMVQPLNRKVWIQKCPWLVAASLPADALAAIAGRITIRPPHRVINLPGNQAVPAQINSVAFLLWKRNSPSVNHLELHTARFDIIPLLQSIQQQHSAAESREHVTFWRAYLSSRG